MAKKTTNEAVKTEGELVFALRCNASLASNPVLSDKRMTMGRWSYRDFQEYLNEHIKAGMPGKTSFQSVWDWEHDVFPVTDTCLLAWMKFYAAEDARHQLAVDIFALRMKGVVEFDEGDGKKLLKKISLTTKGTKAHEGKMEVKA